MTNVIDLRRFYWLPIEASADHAEPGAFRWSGVPLEGFRNPSVEEMEAYRLRHVTTEIVGDPARDYLALRAWEEKRAS